MSTTEPGSAVLTHHEPHDVDDAYLHLDSRMLALLHGTSLAISQQRDPAAIGRRIVEITETLMPVDSRFLVAVYLNDNGPRILAHSKRGHDGQPLAAGDAARIESALRADLSRGIIARSLRTGQSVRSGNVQELPEFIDVFDGVRSCLCVPAVTHGGVVGAINVESTLPDVFSAREKTALEIIANQLAVAIENSRLLAEARNELSLRYVAESRLTALNEQLSRMASHDELTGLVNRREFHRRLTRAMETARKVGGVHALCLLDLDRFKMVNDFGGHAAGDALLARLAESLSGVVRKSDTLARLGGDEFGVLMEHCGTDQARRLAEALREKLNSFEMEWDGRQFGVTGSIGLAAIDTNSANIATVMREADAACYAAKYAGGDCVHTAESAPAVLYQRDRDNHALATFEAALTNTDGVWLEAQPILDLHGTPCNEVRVEIFARLKTPNGRKLYPKDFLGAVERFHLAPTLDRRVIELTARWLGTDPRIDGRPVTAQVNLSGQSIGNPEILADLDERILGGQLDPARIGFEITETAAIGDLSNALHGIAALRSKGCAFAIDDFGTGLASIGYLRDLPVDWIKIDGLFIRGVANSEQDRALVALMNDVAHGFGLRTVAECVENADDLETIRGLGLDAAQGYFVGQLFRVPD